MNDMRMGPLFINQQQTSGKGKDEGEKSSKVGGGGNMLLLQKAAPSNPTQKTMTLQSNCSSSSTDSGHTSGNFEQPQVTQDQKRAGGGVGLRKYLLLLQDCLAVKFGIESGMTEEDHNPSLGFTLYKELLSSNLKCYWNGALCEAVGELEYKGYLVPSTILVWAHPPSLSIIRTAWSRKMLRSPQGYQIQFIGDVEEMIAEPINQGQFAPLSDSLCWIIQELTGGGQEAFVDGIVSCLSESFPFMSLPPRELVYQTLERLIRERKVYQTSQGYFIVTPDTFRYINAGGGGDPYSQPHPPQAPLDALITSYYNLGVLDKMSQNNSSWELSASGDDLDGVKSPLKRHSSLKVIRQRDQDLDTPTMGARSLSFRLSKTKSLLIDDSPLENIFSPINTLEQRPPQVFNSKEEKSEKKISFFRRLFSFRKGRSTSNISKSSQKLLPQTTPMSPPTQNLPHLQPMQRSPKIYAQLPQRRQKEDESCQTGGHRSYENILEEEVKYRGGGSVSNNNGVKQMSKWNSLPSRSSGRRSGKYQSRRSIVNESPFYDVLHFENAEKENPQQAPVQKEINNSEGYSNQRVQQGRPQSMYSVGATALPPRSQRRTSLSRIDSPSPSQSVSAIYASIGNSGRVKTLLSQPQPPPVVTLRGQRSSSRYPPWRPRSAYELLAYQNIQRDKSLKSSRPQNIEPKAKEPAQELSATSINSNSYMSTSTELQVQIPIGKIASVASKGRTTTSRNGEVNKTTPTKQPFTLRITRDSNPNSFTITNDEHNASECAS